MDAEMDHAPPPCLPLLSPPVPPPCSLLSVPSLTAITSTGRPKRQYRLPKRYIDVPPEGPAPLVVVAAVPNVPTASPPPTVHTVIARVQDTLRTGLNRFSLLREYPYRPSYDPDTFVPLDDLSDCRSSNPSVPVDGPGVHPPSKEPEVKESGMGRLPPWPFANMSIYRLMEWATTGGSRKSELEVNRLANDVIGAADFKPAELLGFNAHREYKHFDLSEHQNDGAHGPFSGDNWAEKTVQISIPTSTRNPAGNGLKFIISSLHHRSLVHVMKAALKDATARYFHFSPFKRFWITPSGSEVRCFDEVYTSDAFLDANEKVQQQPNEPGCQLEKVVLGLMFWSDSTHLASFGTAKAWPLYLYFANLSKYFRGKPNFGASHHVAYMPNLPDSINDFLAGFSQKDLLITHCRRELMQKVWDLLLDDEFMAAYKHGFVLTCLDGIARRFFPRIFTYSADYPEKMLIATIRDKGLCLCPRCLIPRAKLDNIGYLQDARNRIKNARTYSHDLIVRARDFIYKLGYGVKSAAVERLLKSTSLVPTLNTFAEKLGPFGFNLYPMLVVDLMHEFELGVWKVIFTHLVRLLHAAAPAARLVGELDWRFRQVPGFGRNVIRRFSSNASEMKKLAARNFEDLLQCAIPVFEGLLPEPHNEIVLTLLYRLAEWHALAKLRMHTDSTLGVLDSVTASLGRELRRFRDVTCEAFETVELEKEEKSRTRRQNKVKAKKPPSGTTGTNPVPPTLQPPNGAPTLPIPVSEPLHSATSSSAAPVPSTTPPKQPRKKKTLNMATYKFHALGDYARAIRMFGTTDSYSTQTGELEHRRVKRLYGKTNKRQAIRQMTVHERRETRLLRAQRSATASNVHPHQVFFSDNDHAPCHYVQMHHHISDGRKHHQDAFSFGKQSPNDPATTNFVPHLKDHLLRRVLNLDYDGDEQEFSDTDRNTIHIINNRIYSAKVLRVNFTTYDVRRDQDSMNPRTHCDVMVESQEDSANAHPFWYARVLGVFHAQVFHTGPLAKNRSIQHIEFLWVRWFGIVEGNRHGAKMARLPKIGFLDEKDPSAFGFLDPSLIIRGCHLIPAFKDGRTQDLLTTKVSLGRPIGETDDWAAFYVMIFVDRDMYMRFLGGGVGHAEASPPQPTTREDADMEWEDSPDKEDVSRDVVIENGAAGGEESGSDGSQTDGDESDDDGDDTDPGTDDGEENDSENEGFAKF